MSPADTRVLRKILNRQLAVASIACLSTKNTEN